MKSNMNITRFYLKGFSLERYFGMYKNEFVSLSNKIEADRIRDTYDEMLRRELGPYK